MIRKTLKVALVFAGLSLPANADTKTIWFGTGADGIYHATLDSDSGALTKATRAIEVKSPGFLAHHPSLEKIYAVCNVEAGAAVAVFEIAGESLKLTGSQQIRDGGATHVAVHPSGKLLLTAQYGGGSVAVFPLEKDGSILPRSQLIEHNGGSRAVEGRQDSPHPHWVGFDTAGNFAYVPDLGMDGVEIYTVSPERTGIKRKGFMPVRPRGSGPRHMKFSADDKYVFVLNEISLTVTSMAYNASNGMLQHIDTIPTLSAETKSKESFNAASEIRVHPGGKFLYAANRGHDSISAFSIDTTNGKLKHIENEPIRGAWPRNFNLAPDGKWLLAAGSHSNTVSLFSIDQKSGELTYVRKIISVPSPICVLFAK
jgi:6-phosphogluconolactonase